MKILKIDHAIIPRHIMYCTLMGQALCNNNNKGSNSDRVTSLKPSATEIAMEEHEGRCSLDLFPSQSITLTQTIEPWPKVRTRMMQEMRGSLDITFIEHIDHQLLVSLSDSRGKEEEERVTSELFRGSGT